MQWRQLLLVFEDFLSEFPELLLRDPIHGVTSPSYFNKESQKGEKEAAESGVLNQHSPKAYRFHVVNSAEGGSQEQYC